ncbi:dennd5b [Symbiodinium sp. CCMP2592]|nr:dennd5b [Symbiodinium sp. CCMP2592]
MCRDWKQDFNLCSEASELDVAALRDLIAKLEQSRRRNELRAKEREEELQQEVSRLQSENSILAERARGAGEEHLEAGLERPLRLAEAQLRLEEENRRLAEERSQLLLEVSRTSRDNRRLALREAQARAELDAFLSAAARCEVAVQTDHESAVGFGPAPLSKTAVPSRQRPCHANPVETDGPKSRARTRLECAEGRASASPESFGTSAGAKSDMAKLCAETAACREQCERTTERAHEHRERLHATSQKLAAQDIPGMVDQPPRGKGEPGVFQPNGPGQAASKARLLLSPNTPGRPDLSPTRSDAGASSPRLEEARTLLSNIRPGGAVLETANKDRGRPSRKVQFGAAIKEKSPSPRPSPRERRSERKPVVVQQPQLHLAPGNSHVEAPIRTSAYPAPQKLPEKAGKAPPAAPARQPCREQGGDDESEASTPRQGASESLDGVLTLLGASLDLCPYDEEEPGEQASTADGQNRQNARVQISAESPFSHQSIGTPCSVDSSNSSSSKNRFSHKRCRTYPAAQSEPEEVSPTSKGTADSPGSDFAEGRSHRGFFRGPHGQGRILTASLPPGRERSRRLDGREFDVMGTLSLFTPQPTGTTLATPVEDSTASAEKCDNLFEAFLVIDVADTDESQKQPSNRAKSRRKTRLASLVPGLEKSDVRMRWPRESGALESFLVEKGFCPGPLDYRFNGQAFVLTVLAQVLNPKAHPSDLLFCCVCSEDLRSSALPADHRLLERDAEEQEVSRSQAQRDDDDNMMQHIPDGGVLCLVSKIPFFDFSFTLLEIFRQNLQQAPAILERLNRAGMERLALRGVDVSDLLQTPRVLCLSKMSQQMPQKLLSPGCEWSHFKNLSNAETCSPLAHTFGRWTVWWGLFTLLTRWGEKLLEVVLKLLPCVLLEQQVLLVGDAQRACVVALLLRGLLWPFRWQHPFVCAPLPPEALRELPLLEATMPMIMAFGEMPMLSHFWGYDTVYRLPPSIVAGVLRNEWVYISEKLETVGGLSGSSIKLPSFVQTALRNEIKEARRSFRQSSQKLQALLEIVPKVHEAVEVAMQKLADLVKSYAKSQVEELQNEVGSSTQSLCEKCYQRALKVERFVQWLWANEEAYGCPEPVGFYTTFLQTQCFMSLLFEEISAEVGSGEGEGR